jgi:transcriptional regulator with XRE-family HTH domain
MHYTQLFRKLREAKGLTIEELAARARRHRNTVINVESGRPVKFRTIAELMLKMGYGDASPEMKAVALLWLESVSGIPFSQPEAAGAARKVVAGLRAGARQAARNLEAAILQSNLEADQIGLLIFAARHPQALAILEHVRDLTATLSGEAADVVPWPKAAEDPPKE